jgi:hypothetical protein
MLFHIIMLLYVLSGVDSGRRVTNPGTIAARSAQEQRRQLLDRAKSLWEATLRPIFCDP